MIDPLSIYMQKNLVQKLSIGLALLLMAPMQSTQFSWVSPIHAQDLGGFIETPQGNANFSQGNDSIKIVANESQSLIGKQFKVYPLFYAELSQNGDSIDYTWNPEVKALLQKVIGQKLSKEPNNVTEYEVIDYMASLKENKAGNTIEKPSSEFRRLMDTIKNELLLLDNVGQLVKVTDVDAEGNITFSNLKQGYYLIDEVSQNHGQNSASSLSMVNTSSANTQIFIKSDYPSFEKKVVENDHNIGKNDMGDFEIGETIPFVYDMRIPNMSAYSQYFIRFSDKMDPALSYKLNSFSVNIAYQGQSYSLSKNQKEFIVKENQNGNTFEIEIPNLKKVVDEKLLKQMDPISYDGVTLTVSYDGYLNQKASLDTGRPGFENSAKLEFSNDPDQDSMTTLGSTQWDPVVCFTYQLDAKKVNDENIALPNAQFKLYRDARCQDEVLFHLEGNRYVVTHDDNMTLEKAPYIESDAQGLFSISGLDQGTYYLKETKAPKGYRPLLDPIELTIQPTFVSDRNHYVANDGKTDRALQNLKMKATIKTFAQGQGQANTMELVTDIDKGSASLQITNKKGSNLPITGSFVPMIWIGTTITIGICLLRKKKQMEHEEKETR